MGKLRKQSIHLDFLIIRLNFTNNYMIPNKLLDYGMSALRSLYP
jgi:hypothetical protein